MFPFVRLIVETVAEIINSSARTAVIRYISCETSYLLLSASDLFFNEFGCGTHLLLYKWMESIIAAVL